MERDFEYDKAIEIDCLHDAATELAKVFPDQVAACKFLVDRAWALSALVKERELQQQREEAVAAHHVFVAGEAS